MTTDRVIASLDLPTESRVNQRISKKLLIENMALAAADKRQINEGIEELIWVATLKPTTIGVPAYKDNEREILEIAVLQLALRENVNTIRLIELIHRAIPYPLFLATGRKGVIGLSLATKRWSQNEGCKTVLDREPLVIELVEGDITDAFLQAISLQKLPRVNLNTLYLGWKAILEAFQASMYVGIFNSALVPQAIEIRRAALATADRLLKELALLKAQALRETQMNRRVEINLDIKKLEIKLTEATKQMV